VADQGQGVASTLKATPSTDQCDAPDLGVVREESSMGGTVTDPERPASAVETRLESAELVSRGGVGGPIAGQYARRPVG